jgi:hypothetical protein
MLLERKLHAQLSSASACLAGWLAEETSDVSIFQSRLIKWENCIYNFRCTFRPANLPFDEIVNGKITFGRL